MALGDGGSEREAALRVQSGVSAVACGAAGICLQRWGVGGGQRGAPRAQGVIAGHRLNEMSPERKSWRRPSWQSRELPRVDFAALRGEKLLEFTSSGNREWARFVGVFALLPQGVKFARVS